MDGRTPMAPAPGHGRAWSARVLRLGGALTLIALAGAPAHADGPHARLVVHPREIAENDGRQTVITLDGTGSVGTGGEAPLEFRWNVPGAIFVEGTDARSPVARVTLAGGWLVPVELTVGELGKLDKAYASVGVTGAPVTLEGRGVAWQPLELWVRGPAADEAQSDPNPFLDRRLDVTFRGPDGRAQVVPGFYAGDGRGGGAGDVWKVRFAPDAGGRWTYEVSFRGGTQVAVAAAPDAGAPLGPDGHRGRLAVLPTDRRAEGFYRWGRLEYVGGHYLKFREGPHFLKGGTDSPENFLGYAGFDDVVDQGGLGIVHRYESHRTDWRAGDPYFTSRSTGVDSKGIVGALNYLSSVGVNSIYFLPMNLGGDGQETAPFLGYANSAWDKRHYDVSRLHQWAQVFDHAQKRGILLQVVLAETEWSNEHWLDDGALGTERKLFFRELVARFACYPALKWNLCEENDWSVATLREFADWLGGLDPYDHPIAVHTHPDDFSDYDELVGDSLFGATSIQYDPDLAGHHVETWRARSAAAGRPWVLDMDENNPYWEGLMDTNADELRKRVLWDVYLSGGQIEWYAGYHDLPLGGDASLEDFRTREAMWHYMRHARRFMEEHLRFWEMQPADHLVTGESSAWGGAEVFTKPGQTYAVYFPSAQETGSIDLSGAPWPFTGRWYDPRSGEFEGEPFDLAGGGPVALPDAPSSGGPTVPVFQEEGGLVVMEVESVSPVSAWRVETAHPGYAGSSYYRWDGPNHFSSPGNAVLAYELDVHLPGTYELRIHNRHDHPEHGEENDVWVSMDGGQWVKAYSGNYSAGIWNFFLTLHYPDETHAQARYELGTGRHVLRLSARSHNFKIDRIHLYRDGTPNPLDLAHPESEVVAGSSGGDPEDWVLLLQRQP